MHSTTYLLTFCGNLVQVAAVNPVGIANGDCGELLGPKTPNPLELLRRESAVGQVVFDAVDHVETGEDKSHDEQS